MAALWATLLLGACSPGRPPDPPSAAPAAATALAGDTGEAGDTGSEPQSPAAGPPAGGASPGDPWKARAFEHRALKQRFFERLLDPEKLGGSGLKAYREEGLTLTLSWSEESWDGLSYAKKTETLTGLGQAWNEVLSAGGNPASGGAVVLEGHPTGRYLGRAGPAGVDVAVAR